MMVTSGHVMETMVVSRRSVRTRNEDDGSVTMWRQDTVSGQHLQDDAASGRSVMMVHL
jgi:hypothetical protein